MPWDEKKLIPMSKEDAEFWRLRNLAPDHAERRYRVKAWRAVGCILGAFWIAVGAAVYWWLQ
jgi:hypothetical protein